ncbi:S-formylglutathione hydrolase [Pseudomonas sp. NPDC090202]|uniref:S-formylglutathione hydrolase n=1 Tax=unclassified Pseudomonas TaxID=196821 RepID=UPI0037F726E4
MELISGNKAFGGQLNKYRHASRSTACEMTFAVFLPAQAEESRRLPVVYWLAGLTGNEDTFVQKAGALRVAAELGLIIVAPDTSPRGSEVPDSPADEWAFGQGAGFYVDATEAPWADHYRMYDYVVNELPELIDRHFPTSGRCGISGHSVGGHGALVCALRNPQKYQSISAFEPVCHPAGSAWGIRAFSGYLGTDRQAWLSWDASALLAGCSSPLSILIDFGSDDEYLDTELKPGTLLDAMSGSRCDLDIRVRQGYDHSHYFIASFIEEHLRYHHQRLVSQAV